MRLKVSVGAPESTASFDCFEVVVSLAVARTALSDFIKTTREANSHSGEDVSGYASALQLARRAEVGTSIVFGGLRHEIESL